MRQLRGIFDRRHLDRAAAGVDRVARHFHFVREAAVDTVETEKVCVRLDGAEIVDRHDFNVVATTLDDRAQHIATDAAETVDRHLHCHSGKSSEFEFELNAATSSCLSQCLRAL